MELHDLAGSLEPYSSFIITGAGSDVYDIFLLHSDPTARSERATTNKILTSREL